MGTWLSGAEDLWVAVIGVPEVWARGYVSAEAFKRRWFIVGVQVCGWQVDNSVCNTDGKVKKNRCS